MSRTQRENIWSTTVEKRGDHIEKALGFNWDQIALKPRQMEKHQRELHEEGGKRLTEVEENEEKQRIPSRLVDGKYERGQD